MRTLTSISMAALLAGCALFSGAASWTKPGATPDQAEADLAACKRVARAQQKTEADIEQDRSAVLDDSTHGAVDTELSEGISRQRSRDRSEEIIDGCMRELGYAPAQ